MDSGDRKEGELSADAVRDRLAGALADVVGADLVIGWVAIIETIGGDSGTRGTYLLTSKGATSWDTLGRLHYGTTMEEAHIHRADHTEES